MLIYAITLTVILFSAAIATGIALGGILADWRRGNG